MKRARSTTITRRGALGLLAGAGAAFVLGCDGRPLASAGDGGATASGDGAAGGASDAGSCAEVPTETGGPYPDEDGMIANAAYERSDITEGKPGLSLTLTLTVTDVAKACAPVVGARVIIWHCDANGVYSEYATSMNSGNGESGSSTTTFLRGWQATDANGQVTFKTIYPGWYEGRAVHIHFMVYDPSNLTTPVKTSQFCFPDAVNDAVYTTATTYYQKGDNPTTDESDMVFAGSTEELTATLSGDPETGYAASFAIGLPSYD